LRWLLAGLLFLLVALQYRLWIAEGSLAERHRLQGQIEEQAVINSQLQERNAALEREVLDLQTGNKGLEQRAREQLGLIRQGETFYRFADKPAGTTTEAAAAATPAPPAPTPTP
jgi:cell division protein FtsB